MDSLKNAKQMINNHPASHIKVGVFDIDGIMLGKYLSKKKFISALENGFNFCDVVLGWDSKDQLYDNVQHTGWHTGYPDAALQILPETVRTIPFENNLPLFLCQFVGKSAGVCPRQVLQRVLQQAGQMDIDVYAAFEYEFFMFAENADSVRDKKFAELRPFTPDHFGYSIIRNSVHAELYHELLSLAETMQFPIEGIHTETGPGVIEAALAYCEGLKAADQAALFKTFTKVFAQRRGLMATFMAKWSPEFPGQSGHLHVSLRSKKTGKPLFFDASETHHMSKIQQYFVAGLQQLMPEFTAMMAPTINSYRRLIPDYWAPTHATWGVENRTTALRVIPGNEYSQRVEHRLPGADANPYLVLAAVLAAGLWGIQQQIEPSTAVKGNAYALKDDSLVLPNNLWDASQRLKESMVAKTFLGEEFVSHFVNTREWEVRQFRKHISSWELDRYFEII
ncbi:glutamine synthetase family protein [Zooshikella harenae]|uniref:Glutamine synthetase n=1 Tax=Zooshikella harenae TaxID=2827238 RepID=A0ABS5Z8A9_9GAMM|nr:glutamine synthetase [Zooshikella harenae]MBU2709546.1 glutamine synthetase [Zooshikella harenae]